MEEKSFKKKINRFRRRMRIETAVHAGSIGIAMGLFVMAVVLAIGRIFVKELWLNEAVTAGIVTVILTTVLSLIFLKPGKQQVLSRIDSLGLQERIITMEELKQEKTVLAEMQRRDAREHLEKLTMGSLKIKLYLLPLLFSAGLAVLVALLVFLPLPERSPEEEAEKNAQEAVMVDELIGVLTEIIEDAKLNDSHKSGLREIVEALAVSFTLEDSTLTRTAKIATASRRLDLYEAGEQDTVTLLKQQADTSEGAKNEWVNARTEQVQLSRTIKDMKDLMGTLMDVLNLVEGSFWTPEAPSGSTYSEEEELSMEEEPMPEDMPMEGEEPPEGEEGAEETEPGENGEASDETEGNGSPFGNELIYDPELGEISYGIVYDEYYQAILKALTEQEYSEEIRKMIEDYANSLE